ncbi:hypothetical protein DCAR_0623793 [Daucus carota subsp. sativus]|uniref:Ribosomal protein L1 n=1 Tax=Daucus carota subsp. sativus TaxID=79200 RepID=A0A164VFA1_DAUCS|nr:hypothetical protein DCAR_0623793 [Daucus carota subsp. sativus]
MSTPTKTLLQPKTSTRVTPETISEAVTSLLQWKQAQKSSQKPQLLAQEQYFYLVLTLKNIPQKSTGTNPHKIPLPHPLIQGSQICLIIDDRPKSKLTKKAAKKKVQSDGVNVSKVLKFTKLKSEYKSLDAKRKLCESYDMFFADKGVVTYLPKMLGKVFFKKKKVPLAVNLGHSNWKEQIERGCCSGLLRVSSGTCSVVKVGRVSMEEEEVVENVVEGIKGVVGFVENGWEGVRSLHLRLLDSMALPLYQSVPDGGLKIGGGKEVGESVGEDESGVDVKKRDGKSGKKKGRIHEVEYMDASDVDGDKNESEKINDGSEIVGKKRKNRALVKERVSGEEGVDELGKKSNKTGKGGKFDVQIVNEGKESEKEDLVSEEVETKKKKGDVKNGPVIDKNVEKAAKKTKGDDMELEKAYIPVKSVGVSAGKKAKKKSGLETTDRNSEKKVKVSKK